jgi:hypothetical protein
MLFHMPHVRLSIDQLIDFELLDLYAKYSECCRPERQFQTICAAQFQFQQRNHCLDGQSSRCQSPSGRATIPEEDQSNCDNRCAVGDVHCRIVKRGEDRKSVV